MNHTTNETRAHHMTEHRLLALAWRNPRELARVADAVDLKTADFADRLVGVILCYVCDVVEQGGAPDLDEAVAVLSANAVPTAPDELYHLLQQPTTRESIADLALSIQQSADERTDQLCTMLTRDAFRAFTHTFTCPRCIDCQQGKPRQSTGIRSTSRHGGQSYVRTAV